MELHEIPARFATPDPSSLSKLPKPLKKDAEKGKCAECGGYHGLPAIHLDYMGHADLTLALIDIDPEWNWEPAAIDPQSGGPAISVQGSRLVMWAKLTVLGKTVLGVGTCGTGQGDPEKELIGDFLRNAAMRFGVATKLWSKADTADPAGTGHTGGYEPRSEPTVDPEREAALAVFESIKALPAAGKKALSVWADGRSLTATAMTADQAWREAVADQVHTIANEPTEVAS